MTHGPQPTQPPPSFTPFCPYKTLSVRKDKPFPLMELKNLYCIIRVPKLGILNLKISVS